MKKLAGITTTLLLMLATLSSCAQTQAYNSQPNSTYSPSNSYSTYTEGNGYSANSNSTQNATPQARIEQILAPIALYPDTVLSHILIAATYPLEVVQADRWQRANSSLSGQTAIDAASSQNWDPSVAALTAFPELLHRMSDDLEWTQELGEAFLADEAAVMAAVQNLRGRAYAAGNLNQAEHITVVRENKVIYIEPSVERRVYLPYYDSRVVYGNWWWADYPPMFWAPPARRHYVNHFYWGHSVTLMPTFFFSSIHWADRRVVVINPHFRVKRYTGRYLAQHNHSTHWVHNPRHRRNVVYREPRVRERFTHQKLPRLTNGAKLPPKRKLTHRDERSSPKAVSNWSSSGKFEQGKLKANSQTNTRGRLQNSELTAVEREGKSRILRSEKREKNSNESKRRPSNSTSTANNFKASSRKKIERSEVQIRAPQQKREMTQRESSQNQDSTRSQKLETYKRATRQESQSNERTNNVRRIYKKERSDAKRDSGSRRLERQPSQKNTSGSRERERSNR